jgi:hypothetical protein
MEVPSKLNSMNVTGLEVYTLKAAMELTDDKKKDAQLLLVEELSLAILVQKASSGPFLTKIELVSKDHKFSDDSFKKICQFENGCVLGASGLDKLGDPIVAVDVIRGTGSLPEGFIKLEKRIGSFQTSEQEKAIYLAFSSLKKQEPLVLKVGDLADALDSAKKWCVVEVLKVEKLKNGSLKYFVHYVGWSDKWDEWLAWDSARLASHRTYTQGDTGNMAAPGISRIGASYMPVVEEHIQLVKKLIEKDSLGDDDKPSLTKLSQFVIRILGSM